MTKKIVWSLQQSTKNDCWQKVRYLTHFKIHIVKFLCHFWSYIKNYQKHYQVFCYTWVHTKANISHQKSIQIKMNPTQVKKINASQYEPNKSNHKSDMSQHKWAQVHQEPTRVKTSAARVNTSVKWDNWTQCHHCL